MTATAKKDQRQAHADRRLSDAKAQAEWVASLVEDRRGGKVRRAVDVENSYHDEQEKST